MRCQSRLWVLVALPVLVSTGCRRPSERRSSGRRSAPSHLAPDTRFGKERPVRVWEIPLRRDVTLARPLVSTHEPPAVQKLREQLARHAVLQSRLLLQRQRLVWELPELAMPGGGAEPLHLVLKPNANVAVLVNHKQKRYRADTPAHLAAWLEGALKPLGTVQRLEVLGDRATGPDHHELHALLVLRAEKPGARTHAIRYEIRVRSSRCPPDVGKAASLLWDFLFLPVISATGSPKLKALRRPGYWPEELRMAPTDVTGHAGQRPWLRIQLRSEARRTRQVSSRLLRLPPTGYRREFGPLVFKHGRRLLHRPTRGLRPRRPGEPRTGPLRVQNPTRRTLLVNADGLLLGWVGPRAEAAWKVLPAGYYRFTAFSLFGMRLWGPRDHYVPGPIGLRVH